MNRCHAAELVQADRALNAAYQALLKGQALDAQAKPLLIDAQRQWISFRDRDCMGREAVWGGGSIASVIHTTCLIEHTRLRTRQLTDWARG